MSVHQVTNDSQGASLVYPDQPCFLADGRRFVIHPSGGPAICDPDDGGSVIPLFPDEPKTKVRVTFDGRYGYYLHHKQDELDELTISRIDLDSLQSEELFHAESVLPGTEIPVAKFGISTVSSDNRRIAGSAFLGDGKTLDAPFGIITLDLDSGTAQLVAEDKDFINTHLQYCRSTDPVASHDVLVQMNHGTHTDEQGKRRPVHPPSDIDGADVHVIADDGSNWRDMPFGRDGKESCIGHQIWRGQSRSAATVVLEALDTSYGWAEGSRQQVVAGWPAPSDRESEHRGLLNPGGRRVLLSEGFENPRFCHLSGDATGIKFALDTFPIFDGRRTGMLIYAASAPDEESPLNFRYLLNSGVVFKMGSGYHAHPILSPDGSMLLFNSDLSGTKQIYLVRDFE